MARAAAEARCSGGGTTSSRIPPWCRVSVAKYISTNEDRGIRTPNLLIWSQARCCCAISPWQSHGCKRQEAPGQDGSTSPNDALASRSIQDSLAEWSKALASGASPQGREFEPHSCHLSRYLACLTPVMPRINRPGCASINIHQWAAWTLWPSG